MILQSLYALAKRENLMEEPAFENMSVPLYVSINESGHLLSITDDRGNKKDKTQTPSLSVPRAHANANSKGFARYYVDAIARILPVPVEDKDRAKYDASRATYWEQIANVAKDLPDDPVIQAVYKVGQRLDEFNEKIVVLLEELGKWAVSDRMTFVYVATDSRPIVLVESLREWYARFWDQNVAAKQETGPMGVCQITGRWGPMPVTHSTKLQGIPGGLATGVSVVSFDKESFRHYGLNSAANANIGYEGAEGYLAALTGLLTNTVYERNAKQQTKRTVGDTAYLYWTRDSADLGFMSLFDDPNNEEEIAKLPKASTDQLKPIFDGIGKGQSIGKKFDPNRFYLLCLSANSARVIVRSYLETELERVVDNVRQWFADLRIADLSKQYSGASNNRFPLWQLSAATAFDSKSVSVSVPTRLLHAALNGEALPDTILAACVRRLMAEGRKGFRANRMALIKLTLLRKGIPVSETHNSEEDHPAYLYGGLLALFENIQYAALGDVNANVVDKFYGTMSSAPGMVVCRLHRNARNHIRKIRSEKRNKARALDRQLREYNLLFEKKRPPSRFSLQEQALFALGYYHQRAKQFEESAKRKLERSNTTAKTQE